MSFARSNSIGLTAIASYSFLPMLGRTRTWSPLRIAICVPKRQNKARSSGAAVPLSIGKRSMPSNFVIPFRS